MVKEHIVFTNWNLLQDLGRVDPRAMNQGPQTSLSSRVMLPLGDEPSKPDTSSLAATDTEPVRCTTPPVGTEGEPVPAGCYHFDRAT